ncbi:MAG: ABC transporter permease [Mahellales bacterium]|jgi:rhamnose transport system permease protein
MIKGNLILEKRSGIKSFFLHWEWLLVILIIIINVINARISSYYLSVDGLLDATAVFMEKGFLILPMAFVIINGDIDISVASTMALTSVVMAVSYNSGVNMVVAILIALLLGTGCGFVNGLIISKFKELSAVIVTLSTMSIYRGIAYVILGDQASGGFPEWFSYLAHGYIGSTPVPFILVMFLVCAVIFGFILHKTTFGRRIYAMGNNIEACRYSGVAVNKIKLIIFTLTGFMSAVSSIFLTSRLGSSRPNIAQGYELEVIAVVVLGGVSTQGGTGKILGVTLSLFLIGLMRYGMGLKNVPGQVMMIIIGLLLIAAVMSPNILSRLNTQKHKGYNYDTQLDTDN